MMVEFTPVTWSSDSWVKRLQLAVFPLDWLALSAITSTHLWLICISSQLGVTDGWGGGPGLRKPGISPCRSEHTCCVVSLWGPWPRQEALVSLSHTTHMVTRCAVLLGHVRSLCSHKSPLWCAHSKSTASRKGQVCHECQCSWSVRTLLKWLSLRVLWQTFEQARCPKVLTECQTLRFYWDKISQNVLLGKLPV